MDEEDQDLEVLFWVVRNHEEQYSIWRSDRPLPAGWEPVGEPEPRARCLARIDELWTDMRPASLRRRMAADAAAAAATEAATEATTEATTAATGEAATAAPRSEGGE